MSKTEFTVDKVKLEVTITRTFAAPPERLWQAFADPEQVAKWWADTTIDTHDFKVGGTWRYVSEGDNDEQHGFSGTFKEIDEPRKLVRTFEYDPWPGHVMVESIEFEPQADGTTKLINIAKYANIDDLEGMVTSGMERGAAAGLDRLAELVEA